MEWAVDELRVTCLLCLTSSLWVGTADGTLLIYDVTTASQANNDDEQTPPQTNAGDGQPRHAEVYLNSFNHSFF